MRLATQLKRPVGPIIGLVVALCLTLVAPAAQGQGLLDEWWTPGFAARVKLASCVEDKADSKATETKLCGTIVWAWDDTPSGATDKRPLVGQRIIVGMVMQSGAGLQGRYAGNIYNPEDGQTYKATMRLKSTHTLLVEGCVLFICREQLWRRHDSLKTPPVAVP